MNSLIPEEVNQKLNTVVGKLFEANRVADRGLSILDVKFLMNKTSKILHERLAHLFPKMADVISDYQSKRNTLTIYPQTPIGEEDYISPMVFFEDLVALMMEIENLTSETCDEAKQSGDYMTKVFLEEFMISLIPVTHQCLLLADKYEAYLDNAQLFDHNVEDWIVL